MYDPATDAIRSYVGEIERERDDAVKRAEFAESFGKGLAVQVDELHHEVARLKALLEAKQPYTPRVGDVVLFDGERRDSAEELPRIVTTVEPDGWWSCVHINRRGDVAAGPFRLNLRINCAVRLHRLATPAERAAAGLPAEPPEAATTTPSSMSVKRYDDIHDDCLRSTVPSVAPAAPLVLPEHLALLVASADYWSTHGQSEEKWERMIQAGKDLLAAVARRDGGGR